MRNRIPGSFSHFPLPPFGLNVLFPHKRNIKVVLGFVINANLLSGTLNLQNFVFYALERRDKEKRKKMGKTPTQIHANQPVAFRELMDSDSIYHKFLNRMIFFF